MPINAAIGIWPALLGMQAGVALEPMKICTVVGCSSAATITLQSATPLSPSAGYTLTARVNGARHSCSIDVATTPRDLAACRTRDDAPHAGLHVTRSEQIIYVFGSAPRVVRVELDQDGRRLGAAVFHPTYEAFQPNGSQCDPTCLVAQPLRFELPAVEPSAR